MNENEMVLELMECASDKFYENAELDTYAEEIIPIENSGYLCGDKGFVMSMNDGSRFMVRVQKITG